jgi:tRNA(adenine34) deaminase
MCAAAISFAGLRRVVYSALTEDINEEQVIVRGITIDTINPLFSRGPLELVPGVLREEGKELLALMGKTPMVQADDNNPS